jgi:hypothetical protein
MAGTFQLANFVTLGQQLYVLMNPQNANVVAEEIGKFRQSVKACGLHRTDTAADSLSQISSIPFDFRGLISETARLQMKAYMEPIYRTLYAEVNEQVAVAVNIGIVSQQLRQLPINRSLTPTQIDLVTETVTCIECGAYRAGMVCGWNLAYDIIRQWIFDNHLTQFNAALLANYTRKGGVPLFDPITDYEDFFSGKPDERTVLDTCYQVGLFGEKIRDALRFYLRRRNDYAHASFKSPSADQTNAFIKDLLDMLAAAPFKL